MGLSLCFGVQITYTYIQSRTWSMSLLLSLNTAGHILTLHGARSAHQGDSIMNAVPWQVRVLGAGACRPRQPVGTIATCAVAYVSHSIQWPVLLGLCLAQKIRAPPWAVVNPRRLPSQPSRADFNSLACLPQECPSYLVLNTGIWRPSQYCYLLL